MASQCYRPPVDFGLGGAAIGNKFQFATDDQAHATQSARGMGVNCLQPILKCVEVADSDIDLLASQYSLIDHANAVAQVFPAARAKGAIAHDDGVELLAASLQFALASGVTSALIVGAVSPEHILADHAALHAKIPTAFLDQLRDESILHSDAAVPADRSNG